MTRSIGIATTVVALAIGLVVTTNYSQAAVQMENLTFTATLSPTNEVPAITNAESKGSGEVTVVLHLTRDAAKVITAATADFKGSVKGFPAETALTAGAYSSWRGGSERRARGESDDEGRGSDPDERGRFVFEDGCDGNASGGAGDRQRPGELLLQRAQLNEFWRGCARPAHGGEVGAR